MREAMRKLRDFNTRVKKTSLIDTFKELVLDFRALSAIDEIAYLLELVSGVLVGGS